jgi:hypothetical protein
MKRREVGRLGLPVFLILVLAVRAVAGPLPREQVPEPLKPWVDWVLRGHEDQQCPFFEGSTERRQCAWPARLALELDEKGGRLSQEWRVDRDEWVPLPGDPSRWPHDVLVDGSPATVVLRGAGPSVRLLRGKHQIRATFTWDRLPELLPIPAETGLVALAIEGKAVEFPRRDPLGQLWLKARAAGPAEEARLDLRVYRRVTDDVPLELATRIELRVSGKSREVLLGRALPEGFVPMALGGPLPARLEPDGRLRVQVRPGTWVLELRARHQGPAASLALASLEGPWAAEEVWVFEARTALRLVDVEGVASIDPQQTQLPADWRRFPAYPMRPGSVMKLVERRRGDADPAPDQLSLQRAWWLDFDGGGYTVQDRVSGNMTRSWRLDMPLPMTLGRAAVGGRDQLITRMEDPSVAGVEIRQGELQLDADSRFAGSVARIPAVGWSHDFQHVKAELNLPPGWRLFYASGVDDVSSTWVTDWTLLDLFLVLITALAASRIWSFGWGAVTLVTLGLTYLEFDAPRGLWLALLAGEALLSVLPAGRVRSTASFYRFAVLVALVLVSIPFMVGQVLVGMYPALEMPGPMPPRPSAVAAGMAPAKTMPPRAAVPQQMSRLKVLEQAEQAAKEALPESAADRLTALPDEYRQVDRKAMVSTGPGLPRWQWRLVSLGWRGPVEKTQQMHLVLLSPAVNLFLAFLRVALLAALLLKALHGVVGGLLQRPATGAGVAALALAVLGVVPAAQAGDFPPADLLKDLEQRLLDRPECFPSCASSGRLRLHASAGGLILRVEIDAAADTAVPLPGGAKSWSPSKVIIDGESAAALARDDDGVLWVAVAAGKHQVVLDGPLPPVEAVDIPLPLKPHRVEAELSGWTLSGLRDDGVPEDSLRLLRERGSEAGATAALELGEMPPFARLERNLRFGVSWEVDSVLTRLTPVGTAFTVEVPLIAGESVTSADVRVEKGKAMVVLSPAASQARWHSILEPAAAITLQAPPNAPWTEVWRLDAGPLWHVEPRGIPPIHLSPGPGPRLREWRPWPGESVSIDVVRPEGFPGQTLTVDHTALEMSPGMRSSDVTLSLEIRSSRGGQHAFTLPEDVELQSVAINGSTQPIRQEKRIVTVPIVPGVQTIALVWRSPHGISTRIHSPRFSVGATSVNAETTIRMPADRWTLAVGGGRLGPAVLFWSLLVVVLMAALALGRARATPLGSVQWFLLGVGLTQEPIWVGAIVAGWLLALGWRLRHGSEVSDNRFNWMQIGLALWTAAAIAGLFVSIRQGLLGLPEMQIAGNGSSAQALRWFHDRAAAELPLAWVVSVPLMAYRLAMLAWALWIAWALLSWLRWGWGAFSAGGLWRAGARGWRLKRG